MYSTIFFYILLALTKIKIAKYILFDKNLDILYKKWYTILCFENCLKVVNI